MPEEIQAKKAASLAIDARQPDAAQLAAELFVLRALFDTRMAAEQRATIIRKLSAYAFIEPEHQVVFEAIGAVPRAALFSKTSLAIQLNNRGFPDVDLEKYLADEPLDGEDALEQAQQLVRASGAG